MEAQITTKTRITVRMTHLTGPVYRRERVRTKAGIKTMSIVGRCIQEGGTVGARTWYDKAGNEWMEVHMDWTKEPEA